MSKKDYSKIRKANTNKNKEVKMEEEKLEDVKDVKEVEEVKEEKVEEVKEVKDAKEVKEEKVEEPVKENNLKKAILVLTERLNLREKNDIDSKAIYVITKQDNILVDTEFEDDEFFKVQVNNMSGFCVKQYLNIQE